MFPHPLIFVPVLMRKGIIASYRKGKKHFFVAKTRYFVDNFMWKMWISPILKGLLQCLQHLRPP